MHCRISSDPSVTHGLLLPADKVLSKCKIEWRVSLGFNSSGAQAALREEASVARLPTVTGQTPCCPYGLIAGVILLAGIEGGQHVLIDRIAAGIL